MTMLSLMSNILVFSATCLLVLPAGWCCTPSTEAEELAAPSCSACASHRGGASSDSHPLQIPDGECQCCEVLPALVMAAKVDLPAIFALPVAHVDLSAALLAPQGMAESRIIDPGPPFRILQCVMRC